MADINGDQPLLVLVKVVATDGPINELRSTALAAFAADAGFPIKHEAFVTGLLDRGRGPFQKAVDGLAWGS